MLRARKLGVPTPVLYHMDAATACIYMERVQGHSVKTLLRGAEGTMSEAGESCRGGRFFFGCGDLAGLPGLQHAAAA